MVPGYLGLGPQPGAGPGSLLVPAGLAPDTLGRINASGAPLTTCRWVRSMGGTVVS
jgi:hypothetical protein